MNDPVEVNLNITIRLSEKLEDQVERIISVLTTATHLYKEEEDDDDENS